MRGLGVSRVPRDAAGGDRVAAPCQGLGPPLAHGGYAREILGSLRWGCPEQVQEGGAGGHGHREVIEQVLGTRCHRALHHQPHHHVPWPHGQRLDGDRRQRVCDKDSHHGGIGASLVPAPLAPPWPRILPGSSLHCTEAMSR